MIVQARSFLTRNLPPAGMLGGWRDFLTAVYYRVEVVVPYPDRLEGELHELRLGPVAISRFRASQQRVFRSRFGAAADTSDDYVVIFPMSTGAKAYFNQRGRSGYFGAGAAVMLHSSEGYEASCPDDYENVTIKLPAALLRERVRGVDDLCARPEAANPAVASMVAGLATRLLDNMGDLPSNRDESLALSVTSLVAAMLSTPAEAGAAVEERSLMEMCLRRVCTYATSHLADPDLSPAAVAAAQGISLRYLHKLFTRKGTTFGRWLLEARLAAARRAIEADHSLSRSLQSIAFASGFSSQAHFSTQYRTHFGESPRDTRANLRLAPAAPSNS